ncbi:MerR family transcriptional regulator [Staphylococcus schleiferi]|nr:MerR family transcriptional regulator [Staphylococcus schleiferi]
MSYYSTGELAEKFNISKRTLQYYDRQKLLKPAFVKDNQYRIYTDREAEQLNLILMMKSLGLSLAEIRKLIHAEGTLKTVRSILEQKISASEEMIQQQQLQLKQMKTIQKMIATSSTAPVHTLSDIEEIMKNQPYLSQLTQKTMVLGTTASLANVIGISLSLKKQTAWPTAIALTYSAIVAYRMTVDYYGKVKYQCPNCQTTFKPDLWTWAFASHTLTTRKFECPHCHFNGYCTEVYDES